MLMRGIFCAIFIQLLLVHYYYYYY